MNWKDLVPEKSLPRVSRKITEFACGQIWICKTMNPEYTKIFRILKINNTYSAKIETLYQSNNLLDESIIGLPNCFLLQYSILFNKIEYEYKNLSRLERIIQNV